MPRKKPTDAAAPGRDRIDLRAEAEWVARVERQAKRLGLNLSAYIRQATSRQLERDEADDPTLKPEA